MRKISLKEFQATKLTLSERLNIKGGSGSHPTTSRRLYTSCAGRDTDTYRADSDE